MDVLLLWQYWNRKFIMQVSSLFSICKDLWIHRHSQLLILYDLFPKYKASYCHLKWRGLHSLREYWYVWRLCRWIGWGPRWWVLFLFRVRRGRGGVGMLDRSFGLGDRVRRGIVVLLCLRSCRLSYLQMYKQPHLTIKDSS